MIQNKLVINCTAFLLLILLLIHPTIGLQNDNYILTKIIYQEDCYLDKISDIKGSFRGTILYVGGTGPNNYTTIQDAIDNASNGDTVIVLDDTTYPFNFFENVIVNKSINLIGEDKNTTIIWPITTDPTFVITADYVNMSGFTVLGDSEGIAIYSNYCNVTGNIIKNGGKGIAIYSGYCNVSENYINYSFTGILVDADYNTISMNTLDQTGNGIEVLSCHNVIYGNYITKSLNNAGIYLATNDANYNIISENILEDNDCEGIWGYSSHNIIVNNTLIGNNAGGIWWQSLGLEIGINNTFCNNTLDTCRMGFWPVSFSSISDNTVINGSINVECSYPYDITENNTILDNTFINSTLRFDGLFNGTIIGNSFTSKGIDMNGVVIDHWTSHIIENNLVNGKPIYYYKNAVGVVVPEDAAQVILGNCSYSVIKNLSMSTASKPINIGFSSYNEIIGNMIIDTMYGITVRQSSNHNIISRNCVMNGYDGIKVSDGSSNNTVIWNSVFNNSDSGITLRSNTNTNTVAFNEASYNSRGINLWHRTNYNTIFGNSLNNNYGYGIAISLYSHPCDYNTIYHNNFINNTNDAYDDSTNTWDDGYPSGGNYWDNYTGTDGNGDGIGDTPYNIGGGANQDRYPLMNPFEPANLFIRGDADADNEATIEMTDAIFILKYLYVPDSPIPPCMDSADVDDSGDISMSDAVFLLKFLYVPDSPEPPSPYPICGPDPTDDTLYCGHHTCND